MDNASYAQGVADERERAARIAIGPGDLGDEEAYYGKAIAEAIRNTGHASDMRRGMPTLAAHPPESAEPKPAEPTHEMEAYAAEVTAVAMKRVIASKIEAASYLKACDLDALGQAPAIKALESRLREVLARLPAPAAPKPLSDEQIDQLCRWQECTFNFFEDVDKTAMRAWARNFLKQAAALGAGEAKTQAPLEVPTGEKS